MSKSTLLMIMLVPLMALGCITGSPLGKQIDDWCVAGKLEERSAIWLNRHPATWNQHGDYQVPLKARDRIVNGDCSEFLLSLSRYELAEAREWLRKLREADDLPE